MSENANRVAFVCVQNAGRSQMAAAFARRETETRSSVDVDVITGGTNPADAVHDVVVDVMQEVGVDLTDCVPQEITQTTLGTCDYVITMGCSADGVCPATWAGESFDWRLGDPHGVSMDEARDIRDEIQARVRRLFDEFSST